MRKLLFYFILINSLYACFNEPKNKKVSYCFISYINLGTLYYEPLAPSDFYNSTQFKNTLTFKNNVICRQINEYRIKLKAGEPSSIQYLIDPRVLIKIKYTDSTDDFIYIDQAGHYMLDTVGILFNKNSSFIKFIENTINNDSLVSW